MNFSRDALTFRARRSSRRCCSGFTMLELLVSLVVFLVVAGAAFSLFFSHAPLFTRQQNLAGLNIVLRNAVTQMELDAVNAGNGYYPGPDVASWPIGVTVNNNPAGSACYDAAAHTYSAGCFDTMTVITVDPNTPPSHPDPSGSSCVATDTNSTLFVDVPAAPAWTGSATQFANLFHTGDQLLVIKSDGSQMTTTTLTKDGQMAGGKVQLVHNPTGASVADPLGITTYAATRGPSDPFSNKLGNQFCQPDWVLKLSWVQYSVDASDPTNPKLTRQVSGAVPQVIAEQVIGFKIGASLWSGTDSGDVYDFKNYNYGDYDPSQVRSLLVSVIARTTPNRAGDNNFRNSFDGGNYQIQSLSVVINPRNLSMNDN
jgi:prepilin-type N-terminal cleavage/methylation domain-containing protein